MQSRHYFALSHGGEQAEPQRLENQALRLALLRQRAHEQGSAGIARAWKKENDNGNVRRLPLLWPRAGLLPRLQQENRKTVEHAVRLRSEGSDQ